MTGRDHGGEGGGGEWMNTENVWERERKRERMENTGRRGRLGIRKRERGRGLGRKSKREIDCGRMGIWERERGRDGSMGDGNEKEREWEREMRHKIQRDKLTVLIGKRKRIDKIRNADAHQGMEARQINKDCACRTTHSPLSFNDIPNCNKLLVGRRNRKSKPAALLGNRHQTFRRTVCLANNNPPPLQLHSPLHPFKCMSQIEESERNWMCGVKKNKKQNEWISQGWVKEAEEEWWDHPH